VKQKVVTKRQEEIIIIGGQETGPIADLPPANADLLVLKPSNFSCVDNCRECIESNTAVGKTG
jgi:hypothetical protein